MIRNINPFQVYLRTLKEEQEKELDDVNPKALKKKFNNRKDKDIDNDGDVDNSDEYLHKKRKAISKSMDEETTIEAKGGKFVLKRDGKPIGEYETMYDARKAMKKLSEEETKDDESDEKDAPNKKDKKRVKGDKINLNPQAQDKETVLD